MIKLIDRGIKHSGMKQTHHEEKLHTVHEKARENPVLSNDFQVHFPCCNKLTFHREISSESPTCNQESLITRTLYLGVTTKVMLWSSATNVDAESNI